MGHNLYIVTDSRKKVYTSFNMFNAWGFNHTIKDNELELSLYFQPLNVLLISLSGNYTYYWRRQDQFVSNITYNNTIRTIVSEVVQKTLRFTGRITYNITPELTIQYYGQPYITRPVYNHFAYVTNALSGKYDDRFHVFTAREISYSNGKYLVGENRNGVSDYSFDKPDFNFVQFRSNLIVRWEYRAGSELYLVWSQGNTPDASSDLDTPLAKSLFNNAFANQSRNIFLIKCTYRFLQ